MSFIKTQAAEEMETHTSVEEIIRNTFAINEENDSAMKLLSVSDSTHTKKVFLELKLPEAFVWQPENQIASIYPINPRINLWNFGEKILRVDGFEKIAFIITIVIYSQK